MVDKNTIELNELISLTAKLRDVYYKIGECPAECIADPAMCLEMIIDDIEEFTPAKGDYHEGLQEGIAIGRKEAFATLKSSEVLVDECVELWMHNIKHGKSVDVKRRMSMILTHVLSSMEPTQRSEGARLKSSEVLVDWVKGQVKRMEYTNGWRISSEQYESESEEIAEDIVEKILSTITPTNETASEGETCKWEEPIESLGEGIFETSCGEMFYFDNGTIEENGAKHCIYCGKAIIQPPTQDNSEVDCEN